MPRAQRDDWITQCKDEDEDGGGEGVNFTNILRAAFSYESVLHSLLYLQFVFVIFGKRKSAKKSVRKCVGEIDSRSHQHSKNLKSISEQRQLKHKSFFTLTHREKIF